MSRELLIAEGLTRLSRWLQDYQSINFAVKLNESKTDLLFLNY